VRSVRVLFIALEFAPVQQTGAFRSIKFVKYLRELGVEPVVVTIEPEEASRCFGAPIIPKLLADLPQGTEVHHLKGPARRGLESRVAQGLRLLTTTSDGFHWRYRGALAKVTSRIREARKIDAVYASLPPFGAGRLAIDAARTLSVPLIIDMRDAWSEFGNGPFPTVAHYLMTVREERQVLRAADRILTVTPQLGDLFLCAHPDLDPGKLVIVPNGFDDAPIGAAAPAPTTKPTFSIAYVGSYYYDPRYETWPPWHRRPPHRWLQYKRKSDSWLHRSPEFFFRAWAHLLELEPSARRTLRFHHIGSVPPWLEPMAARHGLGDLCVMHGTVPSDCLPEVLAGMDAFLCTSLKPQRGPDYCLASKTFDYIAAAKPIIGFVIEGSQRDFLVESGIGLIADPDNPQNGAEKLRELVSGRFEPSLNVAYIKGYQRRAAADKLARVVHELCGAPAQKPAPAATAALSATADIAIGEGAR
jgi:glycosyltransferase involved in cell wall biosynthesis